MRKYSVASWAYPEKSSKSSKPQVLSSSIL
jgi:hypothetical protein